MWYLFTIERSIKSLFCLLLVVSKILKKVNSKFSRPAHVLGKARKEELANQN